MPRGLRATEVQAQRAVELAVAHPTAPTAAFERMGGIGLSHDTISRLLAKQVPVVETLRAFKRDEFMAGWQWLFLDSMSRLQDEPEVSWKDRRDAAVVLGIATEKALLLSGQPTMLVGHLHEVRITLPDLAAKLAAVGQAISSTPPPVVVEAERT